MKNSYLLVGLGLLSLPALVVGGCQDSFKNCEDTSTCPPPEEEGDGDGDTSTGGQGDGDGDHTDGGKGGVGGEEPTSACDPACTGSEVCKEEGDTGTCVECLVTDDCTDGLCDTTTNTCVECLEPSDCSDPSKPMCDAGSCTSGCAVNDDCSNFPAASVCEPGSGACVQCTAATDNRESDSDECETGVCNPTTNECETALSQNDKDICDSCIADSECLVGQNCIPLSYKPDGEPEVELGGFCMKLFPGCSPPYQAGAINRVSLSGQVAADYCGLEEEFTTCAAIKDLKDGKPCATDDECGTGSGDGKCEIVNGGADPQCTYSCTASNQCVAGNACGGVVDSEYCGG